MRAATDPLNVHPARWTLLRLDNCNHTLIIIPEYLPLPVIHKGTRHKEMVRAATPETECVATWTSHWIGSLME